MRETLLANGWPENRGQIDETWLLANITLALKLYKSNTLNKASRESAEQRLGQQVVANRLQRGDTLRDIVATARNTVPQGAKPEDIDENARQELRDCRQQFPDDKFNPDGTAGGALLQRLADWREFLHLGGDDALQDTIAAMKVAPRAARELTATLANALKVLLSANTLDEVGDQLPSDQDGRQARGLTLDYVDRIIGVMPDPIKGPFQQRAAQLRQVLLPQSQNYDQVRVQTEIEALLDEATDKVREIGMAAIKELGPAGTKYIYRTQQDPIYRDGALEQLQRRIGELSANMRAGNVVATTEELEMETQRFQD